MLASSAGGPGFNPRTRTASYQRRNKNGTSSSLVWHSTSKGKCWLFLKNQDREKNVMDKIWDRNSFEVGGHWPLWQGWKNRMTTQNRQKPNAKNKLRGKGSRSSLYCVNKLRCCGTIWLVHHLHGERNPMIWRRNYTWYERRDWTISIINLTLYEVLRISQSAQPYGSMLHFKSSSDRECEYRILGFMNSL